MNLLLRIANLLALVICLFQGQAQAAYKPNLTFLKMVYHLDIQADGTATQVFESSIRIDTANGVRKLGERRISYSGSHETLDVLEAYTLQPDGTKVPLEPDQIRTQDDNSDSEGIYTDGKVKLLIYPKVQVGSVLYYKARSHQHTADFPGHYAWSMHFSPFYVWAGVEINVTQAPGIALRYSTPGMTGGPVTLQASDKPGIQRFQYQYKQDQFSLPESGVVDLRDFAPHFAISSFGSYADVGKAYQERAYPKAQVTPAIQALAHQLTAQDTTPERKARSLYNWVSKNIRYVGVFVGSGGYVPHEAQSILDNRYGDCKDHVTLLEALLRAVGIESSPALINSDNAYKLPQLPTPEVFDHVITYIPSLDLYLDSTSEFAPFGLLPSSDMHKHVVLTASGTTARTPYVDVKKHFTETRTTLKLKMDGSIDGESKSQMHGYEQITSRYYQSRYKDKDQDGVVNQLLSRFMESGSGEIDAPDPKDLDAAWYVNAGFTLDPVVNVPGPSALILPVGLAPGHLRRLSMSTANLQRKFSESCFTQRHVEHVSLEIPSGISLSQLPKNVSFKQGALSYSAKYARKNNVIQAERQLVILRPERYCPPSDEADWQDLAKVIKRDLRSQVFIR